MISEKEFHDHIHQFMETSNHIKDGWFMDTVRNQTFVRKKSVVTLQLQRQGISGIGHSNVQPDTKCTHDIGSDNKGEQSLNRLSVNGLEEDQFCEEDATCMPTPVTATTTQQTIHYEYHIVYNESYAVPVLYVNVLNSSGQRLSLDEVWKLCPDTFQPYLQDNRWTTLTQQEHPLLGIPFLMLHPCHTAELMTQVTKGSKTESEADPERNYIVTWLSTMGPMVGLKVSEQYALPVTLLKKNS